MITFSNINAVNASNAALSIGLIFACLLGFSVPTVGAECEETRSDLDIFGAAALGDPISDLPAGVKRDSMCENYQPSRPCEFYDGAGVGYLVSGDKIVRKEVRVDAPFGASPFPFGLTAEDSVADVVTKLNKRPFPSGLPEELYAVSEGGQISIRSYYPLMGDSGVVKFQVEFDFGKDDLLERMAVNVLPKKRCR